MVPKDKNEDWGARLAHLEALSTSQVSAHQSYSVQFAVVLVANLMLINSGALFAFPGFVGNISTASADASHISHAAWSFIGGIVLATSCGYAAYHNFMALSQYYALDAHETLFDHKFPSADKAQKEIVDWLTSNSKKKTSLARLVNFTLWTGNIAGIASLTCFTVGCYFVRLALLT